jgi:hypothetical protein
MVSVLYCEPGGVYPGLVGREQCWDEARDARRYNGPHPVVAHPPCARWCRLAESVYARTKKEEHRPGNDGGCFASALAAVRTWGGVLEHPAESKAWAAYGLVRPRGGAGWVLSSSEPRVWVCEIWQSAYGHLARKRTWLAYSGKHPPFELRWERRPGTHTCGRDSKKRPTELPRLSKTQNLATPPEFARELLRLAQHSSGC